MMGETGATEAMAFPSAADLVGEPPSLATLRCEGFLCQAFLHESKVVETANVVHLCFEGAWFRLYFDFGVIFWRISESPLPWEVEEERWTCTLNDIGASLGLLGKRLDHYTMDVSGSEAEVRFVFEGGLTIVFENRNDNTSFRVVNDN